MALDGKSFAIQTGIYVAIALVVFIAFGYYRRLRFTKRFFAPKRTPQEPGAHKPPRLHNGLGDWIRQVVGAPETELIKCAGVDAAMYIKILRMGFELFVMISLVVLIGVLPVNLTGGQVDNLMDQQAAYNSTGNETSTSSSSNSTGNYQFSDLDKISMSNIPDRDKTLYVHAVVCWLVTGIIFWQLWRYNKVALRLRIYALLNAPKGAESHTVFLTDIPGVEYGTKADRLDQTALRFLPRAVKRKIKEQAAKATEAALAAAAKSAKVSGAGDAFSKDGEVEQLKDYWVDAASRLAGGEPLQGLVEDEMGKVYGDEVAKVHLVYDTSDLDGLVAEYEKLKTKLNDQVDNYVSLKRRGKAIKPAMTTVLGVKYGAWGKEKYGVKAKVNCLEWYRDRLTELWRLIGEEQAKAKQKFWPSAFVTFRSRTTQVACSDALLCQDLSAWRTQPAARPEELYWPNLGWRQWERGMRNTGMWAAFIALLLFFMIPVSAVQALLSLNSVVSFVNSIPVVGTFLTGILPSLALTLFLILMPTIIRLMNIMEGMTNESEIDLAVVSRYFAFQVVTVFFGSFIAGTFANQIDQFIKDPGSIITILGTAAPQTAIFFMSYMQLQALAVQPLALLRVIPLVIFMVLSKLAATERAKRRLWQDQKMTYGTLIPEDTMQLLLGTVFCIIFPIIAPMAAIYFAVSYLVWKYQMLYVYGQPYQTGGQLFMKVFNQAMTATFLFQLMMIFILAIKKMIAPAIICIPPAVASILYWRAVHAAFWRPQGALSLMSAADIDAKEAAEVAESELLKNDKEASEQYLSPSFKLSEEEHAELLAEAEKGLKLERGEDTGDIEEQAESHMDDDTAPPTPRTPSQQPPAAVAEAAAAKLAAAEAEAASKEVAAVAKEAAAAGGLPKTVSEGGLAPAAKGDAGNGTKEQ